MKRLFKLTWIAALCAMPFTFTACGDDDPITDGTTTGEPTPNDSILQTTNFKTTLNETGKELVGLVQTKDFDDLKNVTQSFIKRYGKYDIGSIITGPMASNMLKVSKGNVKYATKIAMNETIAEIFAYYKQLRGVYEPNDSAKNWTKVKSSYNIVLQFKDSTNTLTKLVINVDSTDNNNITLPETKANGNIISIPKSYNISLTYGNKTLIYVGAELIANNLNLATMTGTPDFSAKVNASIAGFEINETLIVNNKEVKETLAVKKNNNSVIDMTANMVGENLTDIEKWETVGKDDNIIPQSISLGKSSADLKIMNSKIGAKINIESTNSFIANGNKDYDDSKESDVDNYVKNLNGCFTCELYSSNYKQADLKVEKQVEEDYYYGNHKYYYPGMLITFNDKSSMFVENYFTKENFVDVVKAAEDSYVTFMKYISTFVKQ